LNASKVRSGSKAALKVRFPLRSVGPSSARRGRSGKTFDDRNGKSSRPSTQLHERIIFNRSNARGLSAALGEQADTMRRPAQFLLAVFLCSLAALADAQAQADASYSEVFYPNGDLSIQAYLYRPEGSGPFPVVIYNHGSRDGRESASVPFRYIG